MKTELAYTENGSLWIPDIRITAHNDEYTYKPLRGYSMIMAVLDINERCIGWINVTTLGYPRVKDYIAAMNDNEDRNVGSSIVI